MTNDEALRERYEAELTLTDGDAFWALLELFLSGVTREEVQAAGLGESGEKITEVQGYVLIWEHILEIAPEIGLENFIQEVDVMKNQVNNPAVLAAIIHLATDNYPNLNEGIHPIVAQLGSV